MTYTVFLSIAFVIGETLNNKHYSTQLKTRVWIVSGRNILTGCESEASDCPCNVGIAPLYWNTLCASQHCKLLSCQVQEIVLHKMCCTHCNIWVTLFWNSVVNITSPLISSCVLSWKPKQSTFTTKHSVSKTWCRRKQQFYSENNSSAFFHCVYLLAVLSKSSHTVT